MFIVELTYKKPLSAVDEQLGVHRAFLDQYYANGLLVVSGPKKPREGGMMVVNSEKRSAVEAMIVKDPFYIHGIANYTITEFEPVKRQNWFQVTDSIDE